MLILWLVFIFYLSHQPSIQSDQLSRGVTEVIVKTVEKLAPETNFNISHFNHYVRKHAHFIAYFILGGLVLNGLKTFRLDWFRKIAFALLFSITYAFTDELHQLFVPGRGAQLKDVLIDSAGAFAGIMVYLLFIKLRKAGKNH